MIGRPFAMPMIKSFIPKKLQPWLYLLCAVIFQMVNTVYMGSMQQMVGDLGIMREDVAFIFLCGVVGVAMPFPILFRLKFRYTNRQLELFSVSGMIICIILTLALVNFTDVALTLPLMCLLSYCCCFFKLMATFEVFSNIQLWMTPKRDFEIFFPLLYIVVLGDMSAGSWMSQQLTYYSGSWQAAQWFVIGMLLLVLLFMYTCTQPFRFMKPLPFISIDWLGLALWSAFLLELIWLFNYGEHYNWWDSELWLNVLGAVIVTFYFALQRMRHIHHAYLDYRAFKYKTLWPILFIFGVAELMNSTSTSLESVYTGALMRWGMMTTSTQNIVAIIGSMTGCLFCLWWMKMLRLPYTRLLTIGFGFLLVYQACMYFYITPTLNFERMVFPTFIRTFGYAIFFTTLTLYLEELMPFQHFFMGLTIAGFVRNGLVSAIGGGIYGFSLRRHVADNLVSGLPFTVFDSMLMAVKQLYGVTCLTGCAFMLLLMLWHVQPVRSTLKRLPYWNAIGRAMRKELGKE